MVNTFDATLNLSEFESVNTVINNSAFTKVFKKRVPTKQILAWGAGIVTQGGADLREKLILNIKDSTPANIPGKMRISITDANEANSRFGKEFLGSDLVVGKPLGIRPDLAIGEDAYLVIEMMSDAATKTIVPANCTGSVPITKQLINNL